MTEKIHDNERRKLSLQPEDFINVKHKTVLLTKKTDQTYFETGFLKGN